MFSQDSRADYFRKKMYKSVIQNNFNLKNYTYSFKDDSTFFSIANCDLDFREYIKKEIEKICSLRGIIDENSLEEIEKLTYQYVETIDSGLLAAYALSLWFMFFDEDNWFKFDDVLKIASEYFLAHENYMERTELRFFKGFSNFKDKIEGITVLDLPITLDYKEKTITIWFCELND